MCVRYDRGQANDFRENGKVVTSPEYFRLQHSLHVVVLKQATFDLNLNEGSIGSWQIQGKPDRNPLDSMANEEGEEEALVPHITQVVRDQQQRKRHFACITILITEVLERIAFLSMAVTLGIFLNKEPLDWTSYNSIIATFVLIGTAFTFSFVASILADAYLGRYKTICLFFLVYIAGYLFFPIFDALVYEVSFASGNTNSSLPHMCSHRSRHINMVPLLSNKKNAGETVDIGHSLAGFSANNNSTKQTNLFMSNTTMTRNAFDENCAWPIYLFIFLLAFGAGAVKANTAPYGAEHWKDEDHSHRNVVQSFFEWFFLCANIGSLVALGIIAFVQQTYNFHLGYITSVVVLSVALFFFSTGGTWYKTPTVAESAKSTRLALKDCLGVLKFGCCLRSSCCWKENPLNSAVVSVLQDVSGNFGNERNKLEKPNSWFDYAKRSQCGGPYDDKVVTNSVSFLKLVVLFSTFVPYWTIYHQMPTTFIFQGLHMDVQTSIPNFQIPAAWLYLVEAVVMVFFIPLLDIWVYSRLKQRGRCPHILRNRIALGFFLSILAMVVAGLVERLRLKRIWPSQEANITANVFSQNISGTLYHSAHMQIAWQIPQYLLLGLAEVFASVAGLELAYAQSPVALKGIAMSIFWFFSGIGSFCGAIFGVAFTDVWFFSWDDGNINCRFLCVHDLSKICHECHLDYYFYFLAAFGGLGLIAFWIVSRICGFHGDTELMSIDGAGAAPPPQEPVQRYGSIVNENQGEI